MYYYWCIVQTLGLCHITYSRQQGFINMELGPNLLRYVTWNTVSHSKDSDLPIFWYSFTYFKVFWCFCSALLLWCNVTLKWYSHLRHVQE